MNANELLEIGEHLQSLNDDNLAQRVLDGTEVQNFIGGSLEILSRSRIRVTATEPPTREDADKDGFILAYDLLSESWVKMTIIAVIADRTYTKWTCLPGGES